MEALSAGHFNFITQLTGRRLLKSGFKANPFPWIHNQGVFALTIRSFAPQFFSSTNAAALGSIISKIDKES